MQNYTLKHLRIIVLQLHHCFTVGCELVVGLKDPIMYGTIVEVDFEYDIFSCDVFVILLETSFLIKVVKNVRLELLSRHESESNILVSDFTSFIVKDLPVDILADFLLLIFYIWWNINFFLGVDWKNKVDLTIHFGQKKRLFKFLFSSFQKNLYILWNNHVLLIP